MSKQAAAKQRIICCIDQDCFYAQVLEQLNPSLRGKPVCVQQKYISVTCNYTARRMGINKLMGLDEARAACPELVIVDGSDLRPFRKASSSIYRLLSNTFPNCPLERNGFDEVFADITSLVETRLSNCSLQSPTSVYNISGHVYQTGAKVSVREDQTGREVTFGDLNLFENPSLDNPDLLASSTSNQSELIRLAIGSQIVAEARDEIRRVLGFHCCGGISTSRFGAKLAVDLQKPNQQSIIPSWEIANLARNLPLRKLPGIGYRSCGVIRAHWPDVHTVRQLLDKLQESEDSMKTLRQVFGGDEKRAKLCIHLCNGFDPRAIVHSGLLKSISQEETALPHPETWVAAIERLNGLLERILEFIVDRMSNEREYPSVIRLAIRNKASEIAKKTSRYTQRESRQCKIPSHVFHELRIKLETGGVDEEKAFEMLREPLWNLLSNLFYSILPKSSTRRFVLSHMNVCVTSFVSTRTTSPDTCQSQKLDKYLLQPKQVERDGDKNVKSDGNKIAKSDASKKIESDASKKIESDETPWWQYTPKSVVNVDTSNEGYGTNDNVVDLINEKPNNSIVGLERSNNTSSDRSSKHSSKASRSNSTYKTTTLNLNNVYSMGDLDSVDQEVLTQLPIELQVEIQQAQREYRKRKYGTLSQFLTHKVQKL